MIEIKRLREEAKKKEDKLLNDDDQSKISKLLADWEYEKREALHNITVLKSKVIKLGITSA